ncbi:MAG: hypothetical protein AAF384_09760 [Pseudomonadota bacterium]
MGVAATVKRSQFAVSWIYEQFHACRLQHGKVVEEWHAPIDVVELMDFNVAFVRAAEILGMNKGGDVALIYESDDHSHTFLEMPLMSARDLERVLERRVEQEKPFEDDAVWSFNVVDSQTHGSGVLLHIMPARVRDAILRICQESHVMPMKMMPLTEVASSFVVQQNYPAAETSLLIMVFPQRVELVVTDAAGGVLFVRELHYLWRNDNYDRLHTDIERTLLYVKQHQHAVDRLVLLGAEAELAEGPLTANFGLPVDVIPHTEHAGYWVRALAPVPMTSNSNFVPRSVQRATQRKRTLRAATWLTASNALCAMLVTVWVEYLLWQQTQADPTWQDRLSQLHAERDSLLAERSRLQILGEQLQRLTPAAQPTAAHFVAGLGNMMPAGAVLGSAKIEQHEAAWRFELNGATEPTMEDAVKILESFTSNLASEPWLATVDDDWRQVWLEKLKTGGAADPGLVGFEISGGLPR